MNISYENEYIYMLRQLNVDIIVSDGLSVHMCVSQLMISRCIVYFINFV